MKRSALPYLIAAVALSISFYSCKCHDVQCAAFRTEHWSWLYIQQGDTLAFQNDAGDRVDFVMVNKTQTEAYVSKPIASEFGGCAMEPCSATGALWGIDSLGGHIAALRHELIQDVQHQELARLSYEVDDFSDDIPMPFQWEESEDYRFTRQVAADVHLGSHTYGQVLVIERKPSDQQFRIRKVYFAEHYGVIAFENNTGSLYYLR